MVKSIAHGRPTLADVARRAGVSPTTVSFVLNDRPAGIKEATRERVLAAVRELRYSSNAHVAALQRGKTYTLGIQVDISRGFVPYDFIMGQLVEGISAAAHASHYHLLFYTGLSSNPQEPPAEAFLDRRVDGLIMIAPPVGSNLLAAMSDAKFPCVAVLQRHIPPGGMCVDADNVEAARTVVAHLYTLGHRRIAHIGGNRQSGNFSDRAEGYRLGLAAVGLPLDPTLLRTMSLQPDPRAELHALLRLPNPPTAIFCCNDDTAIVVLKAAAELGLRVPADISIAGFDDIPAAAACSPPLTTIRPPFQQIGRLAASSLISAIENDLSPHTHLLVPTELVIRGSTGLVVV